MYENKDRLSEKSPKITTLLVSTGRKIIKNRRMLCHQLLFAIINFNCMNVTLFLCFVKNAKITLFSWAQSFTCALHRRDTSDDRRSG